MDGVSWCGRNPWRRQRWSSRVEVEHGVHGQPLGKRKRGGFRSCRGKLHGPKMAEKGGVERRPQQDLAGGDLRIFGRSRAAEGTGAGWASGVERGGECARSERGRESREARGRVFVQRRPLGFVRTRGSKERERGTSIGSSGRCRWGQCGAGRRRGLASGRREDEAP